MEIPCTKPVNSAIKWFVTLCKTIQKLIMENTDEEKKAYIAGRGLIETVLKLPLSDVINKDLYKHKIPETFASTSEYFKSFIPSLIEETRAEIHSGLQALANSPVLKVTRTSAHKDHNSPTTLLYELEMTKANKDKTKEEKKKEESYEPRFGDLLALTDVRPKRIEDINRPKFRYIIAVVTEADEDSSLSATIMASKPVKTGHWWPEDDDEDCYNIDRLFAVHLASLTTNLRIWEALHPSTLQDTSMITKVLNRKQLKEDDDIDEDSICEELGCYGLNESQESAIRSCVAKSGCFDKRSVKLIWGPPGTGKTKTVACLLKSLLKMNCSTLSCAPTNIAVMGIADRFLKTSFLEDKSYGLGDILLFGNRKRMMIDHNSKLDAILLENRVNVLRQVYSPVCGWRSSICSLTSLFEDSHGKYGMYIYELNKADEEGEKRITKKMTYAEFVAEYFERNGGNVIRNIEELVKHLPTSFLTLEKADSMMRTSDLLVVFEKLLKKAKVHGYEVDDLMEEWADRMVLALNRLPSLPIFNYHGERDLKDFCFQNACVLLGTVSGSARLRNIAKSVRIVIVDEASQLKECESTIPLQLQGLRHVVLVGDEKQLSAMVVSEVAKKANFGRSLFQRLVSLGHNKLLLNIQYRMHPAISSFPKSEFYKNRIMDNENVKKLDYCKRFLEGNMFGAYSFINVAFGDEEKQRNSLKNTVEIAVIEDIISRLHKGKRWRPCVGVISPYKSQAKAIDETLEKLRDKNFPVTVRSVDGFQGGEEDIIMVSTVRSNSTGNIGFLCNRQRTNVALTRARHCAWIIGHGPTLMKSRSVWSELIRDAKNRKCYYNAEDDKSLAVAISAAMIGMGKAADLLADPAFLKNSEWTVDFSDTFINSLKRIMNPEVIKEALQLMQKLANGWRSSISDSRTDSKFVKQCRITDELALTWCVDIKEDAWYYTQFLKFWEIQPANELKEVTSKIENIYRLYSSTKQQLCLFVFKERILVLPKQWSSEELKLTSLTSDLENLDMSNSDHTSDGEVASVATELDMPDDDIESVSDLDIAEHDGSLSS